jgi:hypothetical protein
MKELLYKQIERYRVEVKQLRRRTSSSVSAIVADTLEGVIANLEALVTEIKRTEKAEAKETKANSSMSLTDAASKILRGDSLEEAPGGLEASAEKSKFGGYRARVTRGSSIVFLSQDSWEEESDAVEAAQYYIDEVRPIYNTRARDGKWFNYVKSSKVKSESSELEEDSSEFEDYEDYKVGTTYNSNPRGYRPTVYEDDKEVFSTVFVWKDQDDAIAAAKEIVDKKFFEKVKDGPEFGLMRFVLDALKKGELTHNNEKYLKSLMQ